MAPCHGRLLLLLLLLMMMMMMLTSMTFDVIKTAYTTAADDKFYRENTTYSLGSGCLNAARRIGYSLF